MHCQADEQLEFVVFAQTGTGRLDPASDENFNNNLVDLVWPNRGFRIRRSKKTHEKIEKSKEISYFEVLDVLF
jgi:hypothetical protein